MAESNFRGPINSMGSLEAQESNSTTASLEPMDGPSLFYQGVGMPDIRSFPFQKDGTAPARVSAFMGPPDCVVVDAIPQTFSSTVLAASQSLATTGPIAVALVTTVGSNPTVNSQFMAVGVPILPQGTSIVTTANIALDYGFTSGTTAATGTTLVVPDNTVFTLGQWLCIGNVANAAATASLLTQVTGFSTANFTTIYITPSAATAQCAPVGQADLYGSGLLPLNSPLIPAPVPNRINPNMAAGLARVHNPREALARAVYITVTALASTSGTYTFEVFGWDLWRQPMTEIITSTLATTSATQVWGKKAFKFISNVVASVLQTTATVSVGISDVFGFPLRVDEFPHVSIVSGTAWITSAAGFVAAVSTTAGTTGATNTTGDVRGTMQVSGVGGTTIIPANVATSGGTTRFYVQQNFGTWNILFGTPNNTVPMFGTTQSTT